jgi:hydrogenase maturation factor
MTTNDLVARIAPDTERSRSDILPLACAAAVEVLGWPHQVRLTLLAENPSFGHWLAATLRYRAAEIDSATETALK